MAEEITLKTAGLRPWLLKAVNFIGQGSQLSADRIIDAAVKKAGASDFGEEWTDTALRALVDSINAEARLSAVGSKIVNERLKGALVTRLRAEKIFRHHPQILESAVAPIRLVTGLQRTGTTYMQRLLSMAPDARALLSWESLDPVPHGEVGETKIRIRNAKLSEKALAWMSPGFFAIHPIDTERPEEDVLLLDPTFMSTAPEATMHVPSYAAWLERQDHGVAYRWEKKMLKLLQWQRPAEHWVLKSPHHLEHLDVFLDVFPDTRIIWMHRDPVECVPSFLSMVYHGRAMFSDDVSISEVREHWLRKNAYMIDRAMSASDLVVQSTHHIKFETFVNDPVNTIQGLYASHFECEPLGEEDLKPIYGEVEAHSRHRFGVHRYEAADFDLSHDAIKTRLNSYIQRFIDHE